MNGLLGSMFLNCPLCSFNQFGGEAAQILYVQFLLSLNACGSGMNRLVISSSCCQNFFIAFIGW